MNRINAAVHRNVLFRTVSRVCRSYQRWYGNHHYDPVRNGERWLLEQLRAWDAKVVIDGGANVGEWSTLAAELLSSAEIYAFEIMPATLERLKASVAGHPSIHCVGLGLSDRTGRAPVRWDPRSSDHATLVSSPFHRGMDQTIECDVTTGDDFLSERGIARVDLLKLDLEGGEHLALQGFDRALRAGGKIRLVQFEYGQVNVITKFLLRDYYEFFRERGYVVGKLYPDFVDFREYRFRDEDFLGPNYVACSADDLELITLRGS